MQQSRVFAVTLLGLAAVIAGFGLALVTAQGVAAQDAQKILKSMSDYLASQPSISLAFESDIEIVTPEMQKIQFASSGGLVMARPDKLRATRTGGYADVELVFDGKTLSVLGKNLNAYAQIDAAGTVDNLIDKLRHDFSVAIPGADLLLTRAYEEMMADVTDAKHIGLGVIDGIECQHLAFRSGETDWQLWVRVGPQPIPCKYVITSKVVTGSPQYTLHIRNWKSGAQVSSNTFSFKPPADAKRVEFGQLHGIDEVPPSAPAGERK
jgi:hypothetical protein